MHPKHCNFHFLFHSLNPKPCTLSHVISSITLNPKPKGTLSRSRSAQNIVPIGKAGLECYCRMCALRFVNSWVARSNILERLMLFNTTWISQWLVADACISLHTFVLRCDFSVASEDPQGQSPMPNHRTLIFT